LSELLTTSIIFDDFVSHRDDGFVKRIQMQGAQKLRSEAHLQVRRNDEGAAQSRSERDRWTFYETINIPLCSLYY